MTLSPALQEIILYSALVLGSIYLFWALVEETRQAYLVYRRAKEDAHRTKEATRLAREQEQVEQREQTRRTLIARVEAVLTYLGDYDYDPLFGPHAGSEWRNREAMMILQHTLRDLGLPFPSPEASRAEWRTRLQNILVRAKIGKLP